MMQFGGFHYRSVMFPSSVEEEYQQIHQELTQSQVELQEARDRISGLFTFCGLPMDGVNMGKSHVNPVTTNYPWLVGEPEY